MAPPCWFYSIQYTPQKDLFSNLDLEHCDGLCKRMQVPELSFENYFFNCQSQRVCNTR